MILDDIRSPAAPNRRSLIAVSTAASRPLVVGDDAPFASREAVCFRTPDSRTRPTAPGPGPHRRTRSPETGRRDVVPLHEGLGERPCSTQPGCGPTRTEQQPTAGREMSATPRLSGNSGPTMARSICCRTPAAGGRRIGEGSFRGPADGRHSGISGRAHDSVGIALDGDGGQRVLTRTAPGTRTLMT